MLELAACGAKILHLRSVEYGRRYGVPIHVRSSFSTENRHDRHRIDGGPFRGTRDHQRRRARPQRGEGDGRRRARQAGRGRGDLPRAGRRRDQHRHDRAEHLDGRHRAHGRLVHAALHRRADGARRPAEGARAGRLRGPALRRPRRQAVADRRRACARTPVCRRRSSRRWPTPA